MIALSIPSDKQLPLNTTVVLARQKRFYSKLIYRAICDIVNYRDSQDEEKREIHCMAVEWMYHGVKVEECDDDALRMQLQAFDDAMSFETACSMLKWDPDWVREKVKKLTRYDLEHIGRNGLI
jgi:hypothetical protein